VFEGRAEVLETVTGDSGPVGGQGLPKERCPLSFLVALGDNALWLMPEELGGLRIERLSVVLCPLELEKDALEGAEGQ